METGENLTISPAPAVDISRPRRHRAGIAKRQLFLNYKGGTGKTSVSAAYGHYLARLGKKILMVDLDAQAHLSSCLNQESVYHNRSLYSVMLKEDDIKDIIVSTEHPNLKLVPSSMSLSSLELPLFRMPMRELRLKKILRTVERDFDYIIIDPAPSISLLGLNAILAADEILIPLLADFLSFHGLKLLLETLASIEKDFQLYVGQVRIFLNRYNASYEVCRECEEAIRRFYPQYAMKTVINESQEMIDASSLGKSIFEAYPDSQAASDISSLVREVNGIG